MSRRSMAPLTGIVFVALFAAGFFGQIGRAPSWVSGEELVRFYATKDAAVTIASLLIGLGAVVFLFFVGSLWAMLRSAGADALATVALAGGVVAAVGLLLMAAFATLLPGVAQHQNQPVAQVLQLLNSGFSPAPVQGGMSALMFATGLVVVRTRVLPRFLGWVALVLAAGSVSPAGFAVFLVSLLWIAAVSLLMVRAESSAFHNRST